MNKQVVVSALSLCLGAFTVWNTQNLVSPEWIAACSNPEQLNMTQWLEAHPDLVPYEDSYEFGAFLGGLVCQKTQLYQELNDVSNASAISCILLASIAVPLLMAILLEGGRQDAQGLIKLPLVTWLLAQNFGFSVVFPVVWLPMYCFFRGIQGSIHPYRTYASLPVAMPVLILTVLVFTLEPKSSPWWPHAVALLSGPAVCGLSILLNLIPEPSILVRDARAFQKQVIASRRQSATVYGIAGFASLALWIYMLFLMVFVTYGTRSLTAMYEELWANAPRPLKIKSIEALSLWTSGLLYIGFQSGQSAFEAIGLSVLFGPGAGICLGLAGLAVELPALGENTNEGGSVFQHLIQLCRDVWANMVEHGGGDMNAPAASQIAPANDAQTTSTPAKTTRTGKVPRRKED